MTTRIKTKEMIMFSARHRVSAVAKKLSPFKLPSYQFHSVQYIPHAFCKEEAQERCAVFYNLPKLPSFMTPFFLPFVGFRAEIKETQYTTEVSHSVHTGKCALMAFESVSGAIPSHYYDLKSAGLMVYAGNAFEKHVTGLFNLAEISDRLRTYNAENINKNFKYNVERVQIHPSEAIVQAHSVIKKAEAMRVKSYLEHEVQRTNFVKSMRVHIQSLQFTTMYLPIYTFMDNGAIRAIPAVSQDVIQEHYKDHRSYDDTVFNLTCANQSELDAFEKIARDELEVIKFTP